MLARFTRRAKVLQQRAFSRVVSDPERSAAVPSGMVSVGTLRDMVRDGKIDTVRVAFPDMYGRLMGKHFDADFFLEDCVPNGTHACDYLMTCDMEMNPVNGYEMANWEEGFGDFHLVPDLSSLRLCAWKPGLAMVHCDLHHNKTHEPIGPSPRAVLRNQIDRAADLGFTPLAATELEYYIYRDSFEEAQRKQFRDLTPVSSYNEDYHLLQCSREEVFNKEARTALRNSGIPVENSKGEAGLGQHELNVKYSEILDMSDRHTVYKTCLKEIADQVGYSVTFMSKPFTDATGSGCHIHLSLTRGRENIFQGDESLGPVEGCSEEFKHFLGGWMKYSPDLMPFYAPNVNSYKRFQNASWAPTRVAWCVDNRTSAFRVVGSGQSLRIELRLPGADVNPYLAFAGALASGMQGIKDRIEPPPAFQGNIYEAKDLPLLPHTLADATRSFSSSAFAREAFGDAVVDHYTRFFQTEQETYDMQVTEWERQRYFERI